MIPGVTDRVQLPRLGKIRLGAPMEEAGQARRKFPKALDHFSFRDVPWLEPKFGKECRRLYPILIPSEMEEVFFPSRRAAYGKSGLFCQCIDGETATRIYCPPDGENRGDPEGHAHVVENKLKVEPGAMFNLPCAGDDCIFWRKKQCQRNGRLFFMLPEIPKFGVYEITTTSSLGLVQVLNYLRTVRDTAGRITGIPFALSIVPRSVTPKGQARKTVYVLEIEYPGSPIELASLGERMAGKSMPLLLAPVQEADVPEDLYPEEGKALERELNSPPPPKIGGRETLERMYGEIPDRSAKPQLQDPPAPTKKKRIASKTVDADKAIRLKIRVLVEMLAEAEKADPMEFGQGILKARGVESLKELDTATLHEIHAALTEALKMVMQDPTLPDRRKAQNQEEANDGNGDHVSSGGGTVQQPSAAPLFEDWNEDKPRPVAGGDPLPPLQLKDLPSTPLEVTTATRSAPQLSLVTQGVLCDRDDIWEVWAVAEEVAMTQDPGLRQVPGQDVRKKIKSQVIEVLGSFGASSMQEITTLPKSTLPAIFKALRETTF